MLPSHFPEKAVLISHLLQHSLRGFFLKLMSSGNYLRWIMLVRCFVQPSCGPLRVSKKGLREVLLSLSSFELPFCWHFIDNSHFLSFHNTVSGELSQLNQIKFMVRKTQSWLPVLAIATLHLLCREDHRQVRVG